MNLKRLHTLIAKERKQLMRDKSNLIVGLVMPVILLLVFGYALSLDIRNIKLVIVTPENSELNTEIVSRFDASKYFSAIRVRSYAEGTDAVKNHIADACLYLPEDLSRKAASGSAKILIGVNATNSTQARLTENYIKGVLASVPGVASSGVRIRSRMWFNDANESRYFMIPGVIVIIMSLIGTKLTCMLMATEYEHGSMESMFATPMTSGELLVAKAVNNFVLGLLGLAISLVFARYLFNVPIRGSIILLIAGSSMYLLLSLAMGLLISSVTKNQFMASQISLVATFMPVMLLSGFLYEIKNMPTVIQYITWIVPARYYVDFLQTVFLVGNVWSNVFFNLGMMAVFTAALLVLAKLKNPKLLEN